MDDFGGQADHAEDPAAPGPSAPHIVAVPGGHTVRLFREPTMDIGIAAMAAIRETAMEGAPAVEAALSRVYLRFGIESWDFAEPVTAESVARLLTWTTGGLEVAEAADALYSEAVMRPLQERWRRLSQPTPTGASTRPSPSSGAPSPTPSARSSRTATAGKRSGAPAR